MTEVQTVPVPRGILEVNRKWCKGCNLCVSVCPKGLISIDELGKVRVDRPEECIACGLCEATCPDFAIRVEKRVEKDHAQTT